MKIKKSTLYTICFFVLTFCATRYTLHVFAGPQSTTYELKEYGFGSGGTEGTDSTNYRMFGTAGEQDTGSTDSNTYSLNAGLIFTMQANVPSSPIFTNPGSNYDRLHIVIQTGANPTDTKFAIAISDDNWVTTRYIQNDYTVGSILGTEDWLLYTGGQSTGWGGSSGFYVTGLRNNTTYRIKVKAQQGAFTESGWGPVSTTSTVDPTLTFGIDAATVTFVGLNSGNSYTDSSKNTVLTTSTNAYNGYIVYGRETQPLTHTVNGTSTIPDYAGTNAAPTTWTGTGFGYTTSDSDLSGGTANRFTNNGAKYAGFVTTAPGDPIADHPGPVTSPITDEQFTVSYQVTADATTTAGEYKTTIVYVIVPAY